MCGLRWHGPWQAMKLLEDTGHSLPGTARCSSKAVEP